MAWGSIVSNAERHRTVTGRPKQVRSASSTTERFLAHARSPHPQHSGVGTPEASRQPWAIQPRLDGDLVPPDERFDDLEDVHRRQTNQELRPRA